MLAERRALQELSACLLNGSAQQPTQRRAYQAVAAAAGWAEASLADGDAASELLAAALAGAAGAMVASLLDLWSKEPAAAAAPGSGGGGEKAGISGSKPASQQSDPAAMAAGSGGSGRARSFCSRPARQRAASIADLRVVGTAVEILGKLCGAGDAIAAIAADHVSLKMSQGILTASLQTPVLYLPSPAICCVRLIPGQSGLAQCVSKGSIANWTCISTLATSDPAHVTSLKHFTQMRKRASWC